MFTVLFMLRLMLPAFFWGIGAFSAFAGVFLPGPRPISGVRSLGLPLFAHIIIECSVALGCGSCIDNSKYWGQSKKRSVNGEHAFKSSLSARFIKFLIRKGLPTDDKRLRLGGARSSPLLPTPLWFSPSTISKSFYPFLGSNQWTTT